MQIWRLNNNKRSDNYVITKNNGKISDIRFQNSDIY